MNGTAPHPTRLMRRWLKAVVVVLGVLVGLFAATAGALALESADDAESCCCENMEQQASSDSEHHTQSAGCCTSRSTHDCPCEMDCDTAAPSGEPAVPSSSSFSFAAAASPLHPQLDLPVARAPSSVPAAWLHGQAPAESLYLLHSVLLI